MNRMESIEELRSQLAATNDEAEQAGLLDAIGIQLTLQNQPLEALEYSSQALEIRARLADRDINVELPFASSLFNRGGHLRVLKRFEEAVASYALALKVYERHAVESQDRFSRTAEALAAVLSELRCHDMAARFQGLAVHALLEAGAAATDVNSALSALAAYLDFLDNDVPTHRLQLSIDIGLLSLRTASLATAQQLNDRAIRHHDQGRFPEAIVWATRTVRYCDLFAAEDKRFAALSTENLRRVTAWSATAHVEAGLASLARLKGVLMPRTTDADRRLWCCSVRDLLLLIGDLGRAGIPASDVHTLAARLHANAIYPARDYSHRCQPRPPDVFITYDWRQNFVGLYDMIEGALVYMGQAVRQARADLDSSRIRHLVFDEIGLWIDFVFIDQSARDLGAEVREIVPRVIDASELHFVLSDTALMRSCCW